jgi:hydroxymethylglutaryl-CoA lyase
MNLPKKVTIVEVGTRDGFQNEKQFIPTDRKIAIINALSRTGLKVIQATSFVHPQAVPNLADAEEVMARIDRVPGVAYTILAPNLKGVQRALAAKPAKINLMMSVSESHNRANGNRTVEESLRDFESLVPMIQAAGVKPIGGMACTFGCPFEGKISIAQIERVVDRYVAMGIKETGLSDTIGSANPKLVYEVACHILDRYPQLEWHTHFHNTRDLALANILAAMQAGLTEFDAAIGGLGGCPYAPNASGNISTEDLVNMMHEMGVETGVDLDALLAVSAMVKQVIPHPLSSAIVQAGKPWVLQNAPGKQQKIG